MKIKIIIGYLIIASIITLISRPIVKFLCEKLKFKITVASVVAILFLIIIITGIISLLIPLVLEQGKNLSLLNVNAFQNKINTLYSEFSTYLQSYNIIISESTFDIKGLTKNTVEAIPALLNSIGSILGSITIGILSVLFITFFLLKDGEYFEKIFILLFPSRLKKRIEKSLIDVKSLLSRYFLGLLLQISILFTLYTSILLIFGVKDAVVIAFLCAILNLIPYIGPLIGIVLMSFLTMTSYLGEDFSSIVIPKTIYVIIGYIIAQLVDNFISQPYIFSNSVKSHPLEIFLVILTGGILFGITGLILAIPLYTVIKVFLKVFFSNNKLIKKLTKNL
jgi:predicted PurR-regulated permease PerM